MNKNLANEIIQCLSKDRTLYCYYKDYYAVQLIKYYAGNGIKVSQLKQSRFAKLLSKTSVRKILANCGNNLLLPQSFEPFWGTNLEYFSLTVDSWNGNEDNWSQTSRRGWNLVLQLNFSNQHNSQYHKLVKPTDTQALNGGGHPVFSRKDSPYFRETLAWARLDIDFDKDECLIEEIQSDWIRDGKSLLSAAYRAKKRKQKEIKYWPVEGRLDDVIQYCQYLNLQYGDIWAEAMLSAVLHFVKSELGLKQVYYHSSQSGAEVKKIRWAKPPKSLHSNLPKSFCFQETNNEPQMLKDDVRYKRLRRKIKNIRWFELTL